MRTQHQYVGTLEELQIILNQLIRGFVKVRRLIPRQITDYFPNNTQDYEQIISNINELITHCADLTKKLNDQKLNIDHLAIGLAYLHGTMLKQYQDIVENQPVGKRFAARILKQDAKLMAINKMMNKMIESESGFSTLKKRHQYYDRVIKIIEFVEVEDATQVEATMKRLGVMLSTSNASVIQSLRHESVFIRSLSFAFNFVRYFFDSEQAAIMVANHLRKPDTELMQKLWNVGETECIAFHGMKCMLPRINTVKKLHIPRKQFQFEEDLDIYTKGDDKITLRIMSPHPILLYNRTQCCGCLCSPSCPFCIATFNETVVNYDTIIIHIHGGGFVALSSFSMQNHTRIWANALNIPVFSIDYRLSPQSAFPDALDDCLTIYDFLINHAHRYMNIKPKKIILAGDSAGGNLCLSLTAVLMKRKVQPLPYGLYLAYPATNFTETFSPSRMNSLDDTLLFTTLLFACRSAYLGKGQDTNPLVSPILLSQGWIDGGKDKMWPKDWPKTRVLAGQKDPLFDDSFELLQRMVERGVDVRCKVFEGMGHGILNLETFIPQCAIIIPHSIEQLRDLLE